MNLQNVIDRHGISKAEIARQLDSTNSYVTQLTGGKSIPSMKMLDKLAGIIGCKRWEFFADEMDREEVAQLFGLIVPAQEEPADEPEPSATDQPQEKDVEELSYQDGQPSAEPEKPSPSEQQPQGTTLVGLVRCPQCGRAIRLFAE